MPRSPTVLTPPPGTLPFVPNTTIESGKANAVWLDLYQDGNTPRPIEYGGTGASNAADALNNLGAVGQGNFLDAYSVGDFYDTVRTLDSDWLRRNGALYDSTDYPTLAALLPSLPDGVEWSAFGSGISGTIQALYVSSTEILVASASGSGSTLIFRSTDFSTFALVATVGSINPTRIYRFGTTYVLAGLSSTGAGLVSTSSDAVVWSSPNSIVGIQGQLCSIAFDGTTYVAAGNGNSGNGAFARSTDLVSWTAVLTSSTGAIYDIKYLNSQFIAVGVGGNILTSSNGSTFAVQSSGTTQVLYKVGYGNGLYVVTGNSGLIITSTNGSSPWTLRTSGTTAQLIGGVVYSDSGFMVLGNTGVSRISTNGTVWSSTLTGTSSNFVDADFNKTQQNIYYGATSSGLFQGSRTLPTQFRVPNDEPQYGWIKARND